MTTTTTTLPITITIEVTGTFIPGNLHKVRDEEPQGDTFDDLEVEGITIDGADGTLYQQGSFQSSFAEDVIAAHRDAIIEALLAEHGNSAP